MESLHKLTKEEIRENYGYYLTVGQLRKAIENLPDDANVVVERVEDVYYEKYGWATLPIPNDLQPDCDDEYHPATCAWTEEDKQLLYIAMHY